MDVCLDLETLAVSPDATILAAAGIKFDPFDDYLERGVQFSELESFSYLIDIDTQDRKVDDGTINWWSKQSKEVIDMMFAPENRIQLPDLLDHITKFVWHCGHIWCQGPVFDICILENAMLQYNKNRPWHYWQIRDSRTLLDMMQLDLPEADHDPLSDCMRQIIGTQQVLKRLGIQKFVR